MLVFELGHELVLKICKFLEIEEYMAPEIKLANDKDKYTYSNGVGLKNGLTNLAGGASFLNDGSVFLNASLSLDSSKSALRKL